MVTTRATTSGQSAKSQGKQPATSSSSSSSSSSLSITAATKSKRRITAVRKEQNRNASRAYRERRKQKLALLEQLLDKDKARTTVAGGSSNAELGASSEAVQHRESQNVSGGSMSPGGVASHSQSVPFSHSLRFNTTDDATSLMSGNMTFDSSWMPLSNDPVPNLAPTGSDTLPVNDARTSGPSSGSKQAAALPCSGPSPELELITALVQSGYHRHWVSSDENSQSSQQEARRDESLLSFFAGVAALSKPAINRVIYVQQNGLFGAVIENTLALGILKGAQLLFDEEGTSPFFRKDWAAESRASSSCSTTQQLSDIRSKFRFMPKDLQPLDIQITFDHHVYLDVIPFPTFRDAALKALTCDPPLFDEDQMCADMTSNGGLVVWGSQNNDQGMQACRSWDMRSWEPKPWFLRKYWYLVGGWDGEMWRATRWWHAMRNERIEIRPPSSSEVLC